MDEKVQPTAYILIGDYHIHYHRGCISNDHGRLDLVGEVKATFTTGLVPASKAKPHTGAKHPSLISIMSSTLEPIVHTVYDTTTGTWQYVVADPQTKHGAIIDSVLDFDPAKNEISTKTADGLLGLVGTHGYTIEALLETHLHADHISAASYLCEQLTRKQHLKPKICIGSGISTMQKLFAERYGVSDDEWVSLIGMIPL